MSEPPRVRSSRRIAIVLLARSIDWFLPSVETSTGNIVRRFSKASEGTPRRVHCRVCHGELRQRVRGIWMPCSWCCNGNGKPSGWEEVDGYTGRRIGDLREHETSPDAVRIVACDACRDLDPAKEKGEGFIHREVCPRCGGSGLRELSESMWRATHYGVPGLSAESPDYGSSGDPVAAAIDKRDELGSYWELGLALGALRLEYERPFRTFAHLYIEQSLPEHSLDAWGRLEREIALRYLDELMPEPIRVPPAVRAVETRERYAERLLRRRRREQAAA